MDPKPDPAFDSVDRAFEALGINARFGTWRGLARLVLAHVDNSVGRFDRYKEVNWSRVERLVFVCSGNICRSAYAEARARTFGLPAASFGLHTAGQAPVDNMAAAEAKKRGLDLDKHRSSSADDFAVKPGDLFITMERRQAAEISTRYDMRPVQLTLLGLWSTPIRPHIHDPYGLSVAYFATCFDIIDSAVAALAQRVKPRAAKAAYDAV
jgi:protein-tyrosine phosphatase